MTILCQSYTGTKAFNNHLTNFFFDAMKKIFFLIIHLNNPLYVKIYI